MRDGEKRRMRCCGEDEVAQLLYSATHRKSTMIGTHLGEGQASFSNGIHFVAGPDVRNANHKSSREAAEAADKVKGQERTAEQGETGMERRKQVTLAC